MKFSLNGRRGRHYEMSPSYGGGLGGFADIEEVLSVETTVRAR